MPCWSSSSEEAMTVFILAMALGLICTLYIADTSWMEQKPWRAFAMVSWAPYLMLAFMIVDYMDLCLPLAPIAARCGLIFILGVGGSAFVLASVFVTGFGHTSAIIVLACTLTVALAGLVALWIWVDRMYRTVDS
nr:unnamed protein product [Digitaria exilis]